MRDEKITSECKIVCLRKVYKLSIHEFSIKCIFYVLFKKIIMKIKNPIFQLNYTKYEKKCYNTRFVVLKKSINFHVWIFW